VGRERLSDFLAMLDDRDGSLVVDSRFQFLRRRLFAGRFISARTRAAYFGFLLLILLLVYFF
jgi:hypothetical protein